jgi:YggT family protein
MIIAIVANLLEVIFWIIFITILLSWFTQGMRHPALDFLNDFTNIFLEPFRKIVPPIGMFDISPIICLFTIQAVIELVKYIGNVR